MPVGAGTHEATGEGLTELVIVLPHGCLVTVQLNPSLVIKNPKILSQTLLSTVHTGHNALVKEHTLFPGHRVVYPLLLPLLHWEWENLRFPALGCKQR